MAKKDEFSQIGYISTVQSGANALTFSGITIMSSFLANSAMLIHQVEYTLDGGVYAEMTTAADTVTVGLAGSDGMATVALSDPEVYDFHRQTRVDLGVAASGVLHREPLVAEFSRLPGGGVMVPADRIFAYIGSTGLASAGFVDVRFRFTILELTAQQYLELAQSLRVLR